jgi:hypothetical protein
MMGKIIASTLSILGLLMLALPTGLIGWHFFKEKYDDEEDRDFKEMK